VEQFLKVLGYKSIAAEHNLHRVAREDRLDEDIVMYGDDRDMTRSFGDTGFENISEKDPGKDKVHFTGSKCVSLEGEWGASSLIPGSSKKAYRVAKAAHMAEIMAALEAGDEGHEVRNILERLLGLGMKEVEPHGVPGGKQVAESLTKDMSSNQIERGKSERVLGDKIRSSSPKVLKPCIDCYYQYSTSEGQFLKCV
jgi:hypothetical protein